MIAQLRRGERLPGAFGRGGAVAVEGQVEGVDGREVAQGRFEHVEVRARAAEAVEGEHRQRAAAVGAVGEGESGDLRFHCSSPEHSERKGRDSWFLEQAAI